MVNSFLKIKMENKNINLTDKKIILTSKDSTIEVSKSTFQILVKTIVGETTTSISIPKNMLDDFLNAIKYVNAVEYTK